ncbi:MAG: hypothetical protein ACSHXD_06675 [Marinosulfonomonas sp.]
MTNQTVRNQTISAGGNGYCLYCNKNGDDLTNEHIVPESLNGHFIIRNSSCIDCQKKINREIEGPTFGGLYGPLRKFHGYRSKNRGTKSKLDRNNCLVPATLTYFNGHAETLNVDVGDFPPPLIDINYGRPPALSGDETGITHPIEMTAIPGSGVDHLLAQPRVKSASMEGVWPRVGVMERFLAKVAIGSISLFSRKSVEASDLAKIVLGVDSPFVAVGNDLTCPWLFSSSREDGLIQPDLRLFERVEMGERFVYLRIDIAPHFFPSFFFVRIKSKETGALLEETSISAFMMS